MRTTRWIAALATAFVLVAASCGDDDDDAASTTAPPATTAAATTAAPGTTGGAATTASAATTAAAERCPTYEGEPTPVNLSLEYHMAWLPYYVAIENGHFEDQGLDVNVSRYRGPSQTVYPELARGTVDIAPSVPGPPLFNLFNEGFSVKIAGVTSEARPDYLSLTTILVAKALVDSGQVKSVEDLKGLRLDGLAEGSNADFLVSNALKQAGLTPADLDLFYSRTRAPEALEAFRAGAVDATAMVEPLATQAEKEGFGVKLIGTNDVTPGFQEAFVTLSESFIEDHADAVPRVLCAMGMALEDIAASKGAWTPEMIEIASKWTELPAEVLSGLPRMPSYPTSLEGMEIDVDGLEKAQDFYVETGVMTDPIDVSQLVEARFLDEATG